MGNEVIPQVWRDEDHWPPEHVIARKRATARRHGITDRNYDVLELIAEGLSTDEIAARLWIAPATVSAHVARMLAITGQPNRAGLIGWAFRHDILV